MKNTAGNHDENGGRIPGMCLLEEDALSGRFWAINDCTWSRQFYALQLCALHHHLFYWRHISEYLEVLKMTKEEQRTVRCSQYPSYLSVNANTGKLKYTKKRCSGTYHIPILGTLTTSGSNEIRPCSA